MSPARGASRQVNALQALGLLVAFLSVAGVGGLLSAGLLMPAVATASAVTDTSVGLFDELPTELALPRLSEKSTILAADGTVLATIYDENRIVVPLEEMSPYMVQAVLDVEDHRFYEHGGVDLTGMTRAMIQNTLRGDNQGASTLTQQYVKNMLIQAAMKIEDPAERAQAISDARDADGTEGYARKLREAKLAITLEQRMTKEEILAGYLNIAQFGASVYGVEAAAQRYFSIPAKDLNYLQAATIAGITKSPIEFDPELNPEDSQDRRDLVLAVMLREGTITQAEYDAGIATPLADTLVIGATKLGCTNAEAAVPGSGYFCDYVVKVFTQNPVFGETAAQRRDLLFQGGLTITTTLDPAKQAMATSAVLDAIPPTDPSGVSIAMSVIEPGTGRVLAMAQNKTYDPRLNPPAGSTAVNYNTDSAYGASGGFPPGSTFKPFTLLQWLKEGHSLREVVDGKVRTWKMSDFQASCTGLGGSSWKPNNAEGGGNFMTVLDATKNSVNNAYVDMASQVDLCGVFQGAEEIGIHRADGNPIQVVPSAVLGTNEIAPLTMAASFASFSADGIYCDPIAIASVVDRDGNALAVPEAGCRQAITPQLAAGVTYGLSQVWSGTASRIQRLPDGRPASGKTGTTSENEHTWFVGYTKQLSTAVWVGHAEGMIPMQRVEINGRYYRNVYGSSIAAPAWRAFMAPASETMRVVGFPEPTSAMLRGVQVKVPDVSGMSVNAAKAALAKAYLNVVVSETQVFSDQPAGSVARTDPAAGSSVTKGTAVTLLISKGPEPLPDPDPGFPGDPGRGRGDG